MTRARVEASLSHVVKWVQDHEYKAYEPADGNLSLLFPLTFGRVWPMRILQQIVLRSPLNIRPLLGVRPHTSAIGRGYMAWGYLIMHRTRPDPALLAEATKCLDWLVANKAEKHEEYSWGDPYDYATRGGRRPCGAPILIWTALIGQVFLEAYRVVGDHKYLRVAKSVGRWMSGLPREETANGSCLSYNAYSQSSIHNANAMAGAFLAKLAAITQSDELATLAREAMTYTCSRQRADGGWFYAEAPKYHWIDSFHSGYNLSAIKAYQNALGDHRFGESLARGIKFFKEHFFETDSRPKYFHNRTYPIDIQCAAQAIDTLVSVSTEDSEALALAIRVTKWTISNMQSADGHFVYRRWPRTTVTTPMLHWGQGTMTKALASLLEAAQAGRARA